jgi:hypothetical protein
LFSDYGVVQGIFAASVEHEIWFVTVDLLGEDSHEDDSQDNDHAERPERFRPEELDQAK